MAANLNNDISGATTGADEIMALRQEVTTLRSENRRLSMTLNLRNAYIRDKVNHLLNVMGTIPLREEELDEESIIELDPLGIIFDSFRHILGSLKTKNSQLQLLHDEMIAVFSASQVGIMVVDQEFRIISCNRRMKQQFFRELHNGEILGTCCKDIVCKGDVDDQLCAAKRILSGEKVASFKGWEVRGHIFDVEAAPIYDAAGAVKRIVLVYNEITDLKNSQKELEQLNVGLEQRVAERTALYREINKELESFCYSISHDLRAPLRHISGYSAILREEHSETLDQEGHDLLKRICIVGDKMGQMIDDLLRISRVSLTTMNFVQVDLSAIAQTTATMFCETDPARKVTIRISPGMTAKGDVTLLGLVIQNLIDNAWKYTANTGEAVIEVGRTIIKGSETFFVRDNGVGFDMAYRDKLFRIFERLHGQEFDGSGIGLATVQRIISRHRGEVWAEGAVGRGATIYFTLPASE